MANSRIEFYGETLMDVTDTTATPASVTAGKVFYQADGQRAVGTATYQPKVILISIPLTTTWTEVDGKYEQTIVVGENPKYMYDPQPTAEQIEQLQEDGVQALVFVNTDGTVKAVCIGGTPSTAMTIQGTKTMVYSN